MDLRNVKTITIPEGEVTKITSPQGVIWKKAPAGQWVRIREYTGGYIFASDGTSYGSRVMAADILGSSYPIDLSKGNKFKIKININRFYNNTFYARYYNNESSAGEELKNATDYEIECEVHPYRSTNTLVRFVLASQKGTQYNTTYYLYVEDNKLKMASYKPGGASSSPYWSYAILTYIDQYQTQ